MFRIGSFECHGRGKVHHLRADSLCNGTTPEESLRTTEGLAKRIYETFTPHEKEYSVRVSVDSKINSCIRNATKESHIHVKFFI